MIFLAADTSRKEGSLALARTKGPSAGDLEILETVALEGGNFSAQIIPQIAALLANHRFTQADICGFAVATGPGSFTGLRVGLAAIKGLAEALEKPIVAVSRLEAVARAAGLQGTVLSALDAGRQQAFVGEYEISLAVTCHSERLLTWEELVVYAAGRPVVTPEEVVSTALAQTSAQVLSVPLPRADVIARIGWEKLTAGDIADIATLDANYIRRTDAEILVHGK